MSCFEHFQSFGRLQLSRVALAHEMAVASCCPQYGKELPDLRRSSRKLTSQVNSIDPCCTGIADDIDNGRVAPLAGAYIADVAYVAPDVQDEVSVARSAH